MSSSDRDNTLLNHALAYAELGWPVFPVHTPQPDGTCSCRRPCDRAGKHPRISQGRNGATTDPDTISRWWNVWPDANIGIATGAESGLVVLDIDEGGEDTLVGKDLPDTVEQITGSGGRHILFMRPADDRRYRTRVRFFPGLDSRGDGGYIVAPPSLHYSGRRYEWEGSSDPLEGMDLAPCPQWLIDSIVADPLDSLSPAPEWNPDGDLPDNIIDMLCAIPAEEYETWRDVGMALHYTDPSDGLAIWDWWSSTSATKYDGDAVRREWRNFSRRGHQVTNLVTIATVRRLAEKHGWIDPDVEHGADVATDLMRSRQRHLAEDLHRDYVASRVPSTSIEMPAIMPRNGLIMEVAKRIITTSIRPQPVLAVMAATAFIATLAGRKYQTETGLRTNLYIVGLAESGGGKDQARKEINRLASASRTDSHIGGDRIASGPGIVSALDKQPSRLFMLDEIGVMLQAMTGKRPDPHKRDMMATLMTLYSSAGSVYRGAEYADQRTRPRQDIMSPNACIYGTSTHSEFYASMTSSQGINGTLSRLIVVSAGEHRPPRQRPDLSPPAQSLLDRLEALAKHDPIPGNLSDQGGSKTDRTARVVAMDAPVWDAWEALDDDMTDLMVDASSRSIYARVAENAAKLALTYAIGRDHESPLIDAEAFEWGREIALWAANTLMAEVARYVSDNEIEAEIKRAHNAIVDAGEIKQRDLLRSLRTIRRRDLGEIVARLIEDGSIRVENRKNKRGPATTVYIAQ